MGALTFASLGWTLLTDVIILVIVFCVFNFLRKAAVSRKFYSAKRYLNIPFRYRPPKLSTSFGTWWTTLYKIDEESILACAGQDALTYIRFLSLGLRMSLMVGLVCLIAVLPVNWAAGDQVKCATEDDIEKCIVPAKDAGKEPTKDLSSFDKTSLTNVEAGSDWLWMHLFAVYVVSYIVMKMLWTAQTQAVELRVKYLASTRRGAESHTVLVQNIPGIQSGTVYQRIYDNMDGKLGFLLPGSFKAKLRSLIEGGGAAVGGLAGKATSVVPGADAVKGSVTGKTTSAPERLDVYLGTEDYFDSTRLTGDFFSEPGQDMKNDSARASGVGDTKDGKAGIRGLSSSAVTSAFKKSSTLPVSRRFLDLSSREPPRERVTDFDTWAQAGAAVQHGISVESLVRREFQRTYPENDVESVTIVKDQKVLAGLVADYDKTKLQLEDLIDRWGMLTRSGKPVKKAMVKVKPAKLGDIARGKWGEGATKIEKSEFLEWKLKDLYDKIQEETPNALSRDTSSAFVTFRKRLTQVQAASALHYHNETYWTTEPASGPQEIIWSNISYRGWERQIRFILSWAAFTAMTLLFVIPVAALQSLLKIETLDGLPGMSVILGNTFLRGLLVGILPGLALTIFLALVPMFLKMMNMMQGIYSAAENDFEVGRKYYIFQYTQVFIVSTLGGSLIGQIDTIKNDFGGFVRALGQTIPSSSQFFISYLLVSALISKPVSLLRVVGVILYIILGKLAGSDRAKRRLWACQYMTYGTDVPGHSLAVLLLLVFCVMQPFIAIPCALYFTTAGFVARYQLLYVNRERYQSGGRFQPIIFEQLFTALVTFQIVMFAVLSVKEFPYSPLLLLPIVASFMFKSAVGSKFTRPLANLSAHAAADLDRADLRSTGTTPEEEAEMLANMDCEDTPLGPVDQLYVSPAFKVSEEKHAIVLEEVAKARARLANFEAGKPVPPEEVRATTDDDDEDALTAGYTTAKADSARPTTSGAAPAAGPVAECV